MLFQDTAFAAPLSSAHQSGLAHSASSAAILRPKPVVEPKDNEELTSYHHSTANGRPASTSRQRIRELLDRQREEDEKKREENGSGGTGYRLARNPSRNAFQPQDKTRLLWVFR